MIDLSFEDSLPSTVSTSSPLVIEWEHGLKTDRVVATRYQSTAMGYIIGFDFPKNINDADRVEVLDFFDAHDGWLFQGGGYPGATAYVKFNDVTDKESANVKLNMVLPRLDQLMSDMAVIQNLLRQGFPKTKITRVSKPK